MEIKNTSPCETCNGHCSAPCRKWRRWFIVSWNEIQRMFDPSVEKISDARVRWLVATNFERELEGAEDDHLL